MSRTLRIIGIMLVTTLLVSCGFKLQQDVALAPALHSLYIQSPDPYGVLSRNLRDSLKLSHVTLASTPTEASAILRVLQDQTSQELLSVSGTQLTRQYNLHVTVTIDIVNKEGKTILPPQTFVETQAFTTQSSQILGSSNEANLFYQEMRRSIARSIMFRLSAKQVTQTINKATNQTP